MYRVYLEFLKLVQRTTADSGAARKEETTKNKNLRPASAISRLATTALTKAPRCADIGGPGRAIVSGFIATEPNRRREGIRRGSLRRVPRRSEWQTGEI